MALRVKFKIFFSCIFLMFCFIIYRSFTDKFYQFYIVTPRIEQLLIENTNSLNDLKEIIVSKIFPRNFSEYFLTVYESQSVNTLATNNYIASKVESLESIEKKEKNVLSHITFDGVKKQNVSYTILFLISSHTRHANRRNIIRRTWGNPLSWVETNWKVVFLLGYEENIQLMENAKQEATQNEDIVIEDIRENFYDLAKKVIIGLTWAKKYIKFKNILKGDDDTFMNIDNIIKFVTKNHILEGYFGQKMEKQPVERNGRYKVTVEEHKTNYYDPYCSGGGFILTNYSVYKILANIDITNTLRIDDAHVGEVAFKAGIIAKSIEGFFMWNDWCEYKKGIMVSHPSNEECISFLLKRSLIDNGKHQRNAVLESQKFYKAKKLK
ncbi:beta-1,3-galactosyltransferase 1 isoform X2 [Hydra vulgaris]|uniref:Hexosyltransferase n=1 Tax=Hydra vulgaris TaxID=6087 RepID=A0ABM4B491_HYDVU